MKDIKLSDFEDYDHILIFSNLPSKPYPMPTQGMRERVKKGLLKVTLVGAIWDEDVSDFVDDFVFYEPKSEEGIAAMLTKELTRDAADHMDENTLEFFEDMDDGYISSECSVDEEEFARLADDVKKAKNPLIIFGQDFSQHPRHENISKLIHILGVVGRFNIMIFANRNDQRAFGRTQDIAPFESLDGTLVFCLETMIVAELPYIYGSSQFAKVAKIEDGERVHIKADSIDEVRTFTLDAGYKGMSAYMPMPESDEPYRFRQAKITKVDDQALYM